MVAQDSLIILLDVTVFAAAVALIYIGMRFKNASGSGSLWRMSTAVLDGTVFFTLPFLLEFIHVTGIYTIPILESGGIRRLFELSMFVTAQIFAVVSYRELYKSGGGGNNT